MSYGQIRTSSGRELNLSPQGWINNEGQNLNDAPLQNALAQAVMGQAAAPQAQASQPVNRLAQVAAGPSLGDFLEANGTSMRNAVDYNGKQAFRKADGSIVWQNPDGSTGSAAIRNPMQVALEKEQLANETARAALRHTNAQTAQLTNPKPAPLPAGYRLRSDGNMEAIPGGPEDLKINAEGVKKETDANDVLSLAGEAATILPKAHGSGVGNLVGGAANFLGIGNDKNNADAQLKVIAGALVSKMPKMSGPQSDKDVMLYKEMAGQIGDASLPIESRLAALETVKKINAKHATGSPAAPSSLQPQPGYSDPGKEQRYQAWLKSQGR